MRYPFYLLDQWQWPSCQPSILTYVVAAATTTTAPTITESEVASNIY